MGFQTNLHLTVEEQDSLKKLAAEKGFRSINDYLTALVHRELDRALKGGLNPEMTIQG